MRVIPAGGRLQQEDDCKFQASLNYVARTCLQKQNKANQSKTNKQKTLARAEMSLVNGT